MIIEKNSFKTHTEKKGEEKKKDASN